MEFTFKSKFFLVLTIFSIIPDIQASENKRSNNASLFAISATSAAIVGIVAHGLYKKNKKAMLSFAVNASICSLICASVHYFSLGNATKATFTMAAMGLSACIHKRFQSVLISPDSMDDPVGLGVGISGIYLGTSIGRSVGLAAKGVSISSHVSSLSTPGAGCACAGVLLGIATARLVDPVGRWHHKKNRQEIFDQVDNRTHITALTRLICEFAAVRMHDLHEQADQDSEGVE